MLLMAFPLSLMAPNWLANNAKANLKGYCIGKMTSSKKESLTNLCGPSWSWQVSLLKDVMVLLTTPSMKGQVGFEPKLVLSIFVGPLDALDLSLMDLTH